MAAINWAEGFKIFIVGFGIVFANLLILVGVIKGIGIGVQHWKKCTEPKTSELQKIEGETNG